MKAMMDDAIDSHELPTSPTTRLMGPTWSHLGPTGPRWAPCLPHEPCYWGYISNHYWRGSCALGIGNCQQIDITLFKKKIGLETITKIKFWERCSITWKLTWETMFSWKLFRKVGNGLIKMGDPPQPEINKRLSIRKQYMWPSASRESTVIPDQNILWGAGKIQSRQNIYPSYFEIGK